MVRRIYRGGRRGLGNPNAGLSTVQTKKQLRMVEKRKWSWSSWNYVYHHKVVKRKKPIGAYKKRR